MMEYLTSVNIDSLKKAIDQVAFAAAGDDARPALAGVLIRLKGEQATFVATDKVRLACKTVALDEPVASSRDLLVPARELDQLWSALRRGRQAVRIYSNENQAQFQSGSVDQTIQLIDKEYVNYERVLPNCYNSRCVVNAHELERIIRPFSKGSLSVIKLALEAGQLTVLTSQAYTKSNFEKVRYDQEVGHIACDVEGKTPTTVVLNGKYLRDALDHIEGSVAIECISPRDVVIFRSVDDEGYMFVLMPMIIPCR